MFHFLQTLQWQYCNHSNISPSYQINCGLERLIAVWNEQAKLSVLSSNISQSYQKKCIQRTDPSWLGNSHRRNKISITAVGFTRFVVVKLGTRIQLFSLNEKLNWMKKKCNCRSEKFNLGPALDGAPPK
jgi:hypothetical protein